MERRNTVENAKLDGPFFLQQVTYIRTHTPAYIYIHICIYIYTNIYLYILYILHIYIYIYIYIYICMYMVFTTEGLFEVAIES